MAKTNKLTKKSGTLPEADDIKNEDLSVEADASENEVNENEEMSDKEDNERLEEKDEEMLNSVFNPKIPEEDTADFVPEQKEEAKVKVRLNAEYRGCVGGTRYYLEKDKVYLVDANLKRILNKSGLLKPLS